MDMPIMDVFKLCRLSRVPSLALLIFALAAGSGPVCAASDNVDIDYSHNVVGTGTVMTDFKMGSDLSTEASGRVRGSGEVVNKYVFQSNNSENVSIEDQFLFTKSPERREITLADYPQFREIPGSFRLLGTAWAGAINLTDINQSESVSPRAHGKDL
ncbi:MAG TPA: hypothetical protein PKK11_02525 [Methanothrix sp.]|nr:hypothetical protein [Methanothrix sp.]HPT18945.1 hypothetical protein [Methanothrix sp.]